jgi:hypothetical protein
VRRGRRKRTPSPVEEEEEEHVEGDEEEDEEEAEEGAAGDERVVWLRGPSQLPRRPIPLARRPMIRPLEPK